MKLTNKFLSVGIWSENHEKLAQWYEEVLGFEYKGRVDFPNDRCIEFQFGKNYFSIGWHDKVHGKNKDKYRIMIGFNVKSVTKTAKELKKRGVKFIAPPFEGPPGGFWCTTIEDPEGNLLQFFGDK